MKFMMIGLSILLAGLYYMLALVLDTLEPGVFQENNEVFTLVLIFFFAGKVGVWVGYIEKEKRNER